MGVVVIEPQADVSNGFGSFDPWTLSTGSDVWALIDDDHTSGAPPTDGNQITATAANTDCVVTLTNDDLYKDNEPIISVQVVVRATVYERGQSFTLRAHLLDSSNTILYSDVFSAYASGAWRTLTGTARTTSDGSSAWDATAVDGLRINLNAYAVSGGTLRITYAYLKVTYTDPTTDNAIFFGTNF
tara:strand:+ start:269 stop:826 length:558 start_codon:yes stop_codon:yes gene_type:complete